MNQETGPTYYPIAPTVNPNLTIDPINTDITYLEKNIYGNKKYPLIISIIIFVLGLSFAAFLFFYLEVHNIECYLVLLAFVLFFS